jgi:hypothetical protein
VADIDIGLAPGLLVQFPCRVQVRVVALFGDSLDERAQRQRSIVDDSIIEPSPAPEMLGT